MELIMLAATGAIGLFGYIQSRRFVRRKLRFVDAVQKPSTPVFAGAIAALAAGSLVWLPVITAVTALVFGASVGVGVAHGARDVRRLPGA